MSSNAAKRVLLLYNHRSHGRETAVLRCYRKKQLSSHYLLQRCACIVLIENREHHHGAVTDNMAICEDNLNSLLEGGNCEPTPTQGMHSEPEMPAQSHAILNQHRFGSSNNSRDPSPPLVSPAHSPPPTHLPALRFPNLRATKRADSHPLPLKSVLSISTQQAAGPILDADGWVVGRVPAARVGTLLLLLRAAAEIVLI